MKPGRVLSDNQLAKVKNRLLHEMTKKTRPFWATLRIYKKSTILCNSVALIVAGVSAIRRSS
jgi:hypothetical protein